MADVNAMNPMITLSVNGLSKIFQVGDLQIK